MDIHFKKNALSSAILLALATAQTAVAVEGDALDAGAPVQLSQYANENVLAWQDSGDITQDANGNFIAVWVDEVNYTGWEVVARRFNADGSTRGNEFIVNTTTTGDQYLPRIAARPNGAFVVVFIDRSDFSVQARLYGADGVALGDQFQVNTTSSIFLNPAVAMAADGSFVVAWEYPLSGTTDILYRRYAADGTALDAADVTANTIVGSGARQYPDVAMDPAGDYVIVWEDNTGGDYDVQARRYRAAGTALDAAEVVVNETLGGNQRKPNVAMDADGDYAVAWIASGSANDGIYFKRFAADGSTLTGESAVALNADYTPNANFYSPTLDIGMSADGRFAIVMGDFNGADGADFGAFMQRYDSSGTAMTVEPEIVGDWNDNSMSTAVHMDADGDTVVMYENYASNIGTASYASYAERYEGAGQTVDLSLVGASDTDTLGGELTYTFTTTNNGSGYALAVKLEDVLPSGVSYTSFTSLDDWSCSETGGTVSCTLPSLAPAAQSSIDITVDTSGVTDSGIDNIATISNAVTDSNTSNNSDTVTTGVSSSGGSGGGGAFGWLGLLFGLVPLRRRARFSAAPAHPAPTALVHPWTS